MKVLSVFSGSCRWFIFWSAAHDKASHIKSPTKNLIIAILMSILELGVCFPFTLLAVCFNTKNNCITQNESWVKNMNLVLLHDIQFTTKQDKNKVFNWSQNITDCFLSTYLVLTWISCYYITLLIYVSFFTFWNCQLALVFSPNECNFFQCLMAWRKYNSVK